MTDINNELVLFIENNLKFSDLDENSKDKLIQTIIEEIIYQAGGS